MANGTNGTGNGGKPQESAFSIVNTISLIIVSSYVSWVPLWMFFPPMGLMPETTAIINQMMGAHGMAFGTVIAFHLGSSRSAKEAQMSNRDTLQTLSGGAAASIVAAAPAITAAAVAAAPAAAAAAAPAAAADAAPPAAAEAAPPAVDAELDKRGIGGKDHA